MPVTAPVARLDLALDITSNTAGTVATFEYNGDLFDGATIALAGRRLLHVLRQAVATPGVAVDR